MWKLNYSYDGVELGDLFPITSGFNGTISRNGVGQITFQISLRKLQEFCLSQNFDVQRMFTPIKSTIKAVQQTSDVVSGESMGGWLSSTPPFVFGSSADATVQFTFTSWLGLTAGAFLIPPLTYNDNFNDVAHEQIGLVLERTFLEGAMWPLTLGTSDVLPVVSDTLDAPKTLKDFLLERADNTEGTGTFDVYATPSGVIALYEKYGVDLSADVTFTYPDMGGKYDVKELGFPQWDNYVSDMFLTGAGNGYASTSGAEGAAIFATAQNTDTIANTGYWQNATSESDITSQTTLDAKATSYVRDTDNPFAVPTLKIDGDRFLLYDHDQGGDLWLGDTIAVDALAWVKPLLPLELPVNLRINQLDIAVDKLGHCDLSLGMVSDV